MAKLSPVIKRFIYVRKRLNPQISCNQLQKAIQKKFNIKFAKTTIHLYLKKKNKNIKRGRPRTSRGERPLAPKLETPFENMGLWFLKAADIALGGISSFTDTLVSKFNLRRQDNLWKNEALLYAPFFGIGNIENIASYNNTGLWKLVGKKYNYKNILRYKKSLNAIKNCGFEAFNSFSSSFTEVNFLKFNLSDGNSFIIDGKPQSIYLVNPDIEEFSFPINKVKKYIQEIFYKQTSPLIVMASPGYEYPPKVFFDFVAGFNGEPNKIIKRISLYSQSQEELARFEGFNSKIFNFIMAIWPWQYKNTIKIETGKKIMPLTFGPDKQTASAQEAFVTLKSSETAKIVRLRAIKLTNVGVRHALPLLITNIPKQNYSAKKVALKFLERFCNLEDGYKVYSSYINEKTYMKFSDIKAKQALLSQTKEYNLSPNITLDDAFDFWRKTLIGYCKLHFFPQDLHNLSFEELKSKVFDLTGSIKPLPKFSVIELFIPKDCPLKKPLEFACQRVNESDISTDRNKKIWFQLS